jgi:tRNA-2-methylthio-N6-dimethylallyladenosine synthase
MKYYIKTFGCQMNQSDSEKIETVLRRKKYQREVNIESADLLIINCCSVRQSAIDRVFGLIHKWNGRKKIILAGCVMENNKKYFQKLKIKLWHPDEYFSSLSCRFETFRATIPIMTGCNNFCSYCVVPYSRGREKSRKSNDILNEIKGLIGNGCKEITLLGQNVNSYRSGNTDFPKLLRKIDSLHGDFWIRFMTSHPKDMSDDSIDAITKSEKVCEYLHLPIQAGSDVILSKMNRKYSNRDYLNLITKIRKSFLKYKKGVPFALSTDIIVGFPGETMKQFLDSSWLMEKIGFDMAYIAEYSPREGTAASKMPDNVSKKEKSRRKKKLDSILKITAEMKNKKYIGTTQTVLVDEIKSGYCYGKTRTMKDVRFKNMDKDFIGKFIDVKITKAGPWNLEGKVEG